MEMSKEELIEAINSTLISNEENAITADALRNLLTDIVENNGNGGRGGMTFQVSIDINGDEEEFLVTPEQIAHNKEQIDILKQLHDEGKPVPPIALETSGTMEGMEVSQIMMYLSNIMWNLTGTEVPEGMPEGLIFPVVQVIGEIVINGDGTLITME